MRIDFVMIEIPLSGTRTSELTKSSLLVFHPYPSKHLNLKCIVALDEIDPGTKKHSAAKERLWRLLIIGKLQLLFEMEVIPVEVQSVVR